MQSILSQEQIGFIREYFPKLAQLYGFNMNEIIATLGSHLKCTNQEITKAMVALMGESAHNPINGEHNEVNNQTHRVDSTTIDDEGDRVFNKTITIDLNALIIECDKGRNTDPLDTYHHIDRDGLTRKYNI
ncbi:MAG TPA: hypothetical protein PLW93_04800 [Candidatus Absconditabacterales bacterium]|nr:hypothetical protein [Candidatus Absconditabacterales bacterium]HNG97561.1 hypothetical protein [Candidatus Absconditabacterales bacterium]